MKKILLSFLIVLPLFASEHLTEPGAIDNSVLPNGDIMFPTGSPNGGFGKYKTYMCNSADKIFDAVINEFGEIITWQGNGESRNNGFDFFVTVNQETGTWTMIEKFKDPYGRELACIIGTGLN